MLYIKIRVMISRLQIKRRFIEKTFSRNKYGANQTVSGKKTSFGVFEAVTYEFESFLNFQDGRSNIRQIVLKIHVRWFLKLLISNLI